ncbi:MAG TPA: TonB family protein, partial [Candidatus Saccharimonadia bacterium]|nr:TonB family protein [Candidatus Saccharimonadia bacterium]
PRTREPVTPKPVAPPPKGGTVVDLPKPIREERPDNARIISRYDSKAQDSGPGEGGTRKPSGEQPRAMPPDIPLPERYSAGKPTPPDASLEPSVPAVAASPSVTPAPPKPSGSPPAKAESPPPKPPAPVLKSEILPPPKPPAPAPQAKPAPLARPTPLAAPRPPAEEKRRPEVPASPPSAQAKAAPRLAEPPRAPAEEARQSEVLPGGSMPQMPMAPAAPAVPKIPFRPESQKLTPEQELAMVQRSPQEREEARKPVGDGKQALAEHFARLEKHQPLPSFDAPGVFERGPERSGEGSGTGEGGKYRSIASYGFKHVSYLLGMQRKIELVFTVPPLRSDHGAIGVPIVGFTVRRNGELAETVLLRSSGYPAVDQALLRAVQRAAPYHPFPDDMPDQEISIRIYASLS